MIACHCEVCTSLDPKDRRWRSSIMIESNDLTIVIDTGPDFREQMLREKVQKLDAVVFTHEHKDHTSGLDDIRAFNFDGHPMKVYATNRVQDNLRKGYEYIFSDHKYPGVPNIELHTIGNEPFFIEGFRMIPIEVKHMHLPVLGFRIGDFTYITDANYIEDAEKEKIKGSKYLVLNALRIEPHVSHFSLSEAIELAQELGVGNTYFTHISHQLGKHADVDVTLPEGIHLAYDGLKIEF